MKILSYSPTVEAYVYVTGNGTSQVIDLSADIVDATVTRGQNGVSSFNITLMNPNWKYNDVFTPMDRIAIYTTKNSRVKLLTGYISTTDKFTLYQSNFKLSGYCSLYRLQRLYFDPCLKASQDIFLKANSQDKSWGGWGDTIGEMLTKIGGMSAGNIAIGAVPEATIQWARQLYEAHHEDQSQLKSMVDDFYEVLRTHGPVGTMGGETTTGITSGGSGSVIITGTGLRRKVCELYASWEGKFYYTNGPERLDPVNSGGGDCSSTCWRAYKDAADIDVGTWTGAMAGLGMEVATGSGSIPLDKMEPADLILQNHYYYKPEYDHVEMYMGNNVCMGHGGPDHGPTVKPDANALCQNQADWQIRRYIDEPTNKSSSK